MRSVPAAEPLAYHHVDVFTPQPYSGNSLAVFCDAPELTAGQMLAITRELRHFESIFLQPLGPAGQFRARVFDLVEELDFAGHPVIGAACVLHARQGAPSAQRWTLQLNARTVTVTTEQRAAGQYGAVLDQGPAEFVAVPDPGLRHEIAAWFSLDVADLDPNLLPEIISTGLRYLVLPVVGDALSRARIAPPDLGERLAALGAQFAYLLDAHGREGRHWNNDGRVEDVATGSGAGTVAAYMVRHRQVESDREWILKQGRFTGRPSEIRVAASGTGTGVSSVRVGGDVALVGRGELDARPMGSA